VASGLVLSLGGCPKRAPQTEPLPPADLSAPQRETLVDRWAELDLGLYAEVVAAGSNGVPLRELAVRHNVDTYTTVLTTWSPPSRVVMEIEDTSALHRATGAFGGWLLLDGPSSVGGPETLSPDALLHGEPARWTVGSVLLRDWEGGPVAADPFDLLLAEAPRVPAPWSVCRPRTEAQGQMEDEAEDEAGPMNHVVDPVLLYAVDEARGARLGLKARSRDGGAVAPGNGPFDWVVDHVELGSARRSVTEMVQPLGYKDCEEIGKVMSAERAKRPKGGLGPVTE